MIAVGIGPAIALPDRTWTGPGRSSKTSPHARRLTVHRDHRNDRWAIAMRSPMQLDRTGLSSRPAELSSDAMDVRRQTDRELGEE